MAELPKVGIELNGWKEISAYLGVGVRTAQKFRLEHDLPVRRWPGSKARVYAFTPELDAWKNKVNAAAFPPDVDEASESEDGANIAFPAKAACSSEITSSLVRSRNLFPSGAPQASVDRAELNASLPLNERIGRRQMLRYAVTAVGLGMGVAALIQIPKFRHRKPHPNSYRVEGATLTVFGSDSAELWRHTFPKQLSAAAYDSLAYREQAFADLDGDGQIEMLFPVVPLEDSPWHSLVCFSSEGKIRWTFHPGKKVIDNLGHSFSPPFFVARYIVFVVPGSARSQVVVSSVHNWSFACQIAVLDGESGQLISDYWHRGHITDVLAQPDGDEHPRILVAGVNDAPEYKCATLVAFGHRRISGSACDPQGQPYFRGMDRGTEISTVYFPKTPVGMQQEFNLAGHLIAAGGRVRLTVHEGLFLSDPYVLYELDYNLQPITAVLSGALIAEYKKLQIVGKVPVESPYVTAERLMRQVKVVKGS